MKVRDLQTSNVQAVNPDTNLAAAAQVMWECDCGVVPVIDSDRNLVGMITDRDIAIATTTRSAAPADIPVRHVMSTGHLHRCAPDDDVRAALAAMGEHRVRRLPVTDRLNRLVGIISLNDLVRSADYRAGADVPAQEFIEALRSISTPAVTAHV
jgi:CBS domain-containing protein